MKKIALIISMLSLTLFAFSCSKQQVNEVKLEVSDKVSVAVEKVLMKEYASAEFEGLSCEQEAMVIANKVGLKVDELLKADRPSESFSSAEKSIGSDLAQMGCKLVLSKALPLVLKNSLDNYPCAALALSGRLDSLSSKVCEGISL